MTYGDGRSSGQRGRIRRHGPWAGPPGLLTDVPDVHRRAATAAGLNTVVIVISRRFQLALEDGKQTRQRVIFGVEIRQRPVECFSQQYQRAQVGFGEA